MASYSGYLKHTYYKRKKEDQGEPLYIRIVAHRRNAYFPLDFKIFPKHWNYKKRVVRESHYNHKKINSIIQSEINRAQRIEIDLRHKGVQITAHRMKEALRTVGGPGDDLSAYFKSLAAYIAVDNKTNAHRYSRVLEYVTRFRYGGISFSDVDVEFLKGFDLFLRRSKTIHGKPLAINTISKIHDYFKAGINRAIREGVTAIQNPYTQFKIRHQDVEVEFLEPDEFEKIKNIKLVGYLDQARDFFLLLSYLSGMRANELLRARKKDIEIRGGVTVLKQHVSKRTSEQRKRKYSVIIPQAQEIMDKYNGDYIMPYLPRLEVTNALAMINKALTIIAGQAGVKRFSTKYARKTLATRLSILKYSSSNIGLILGHSNPSTADKSYIAVDLDFQLKALSEAWK